MADLSPGIYERLVTAGLKARLLRFDSAATRIVTEELDATEAHATLARHIANLVAGVLQAVPQEDRAAAQTELTNEIIRLLAANPIDVSRNDDLVENLLNNCSRFSRSATCRMTIGTWSRRWSRCPLQTFW